MANYTPQSILAILCILNVLISFAAAGRDIPTTADSKNADVKHPDSFINFDRSVLIPGIGRVMIPTDKKGFNPFTYNPVTGTNSGNGLGIPDIGAVGGGSYLPGGDDTFIPNPGVEVPNPGSTTGGSVPVPSEARP